MEQKGWRGRAEQRGRDAKDPEAGGQGTWTPTSGLAAEEKN